MKTKEGVRMPQRATKGSIGYDFYAPMDIEIVPWSWTEFGTGVWLTDDDTVNDRMDWALKLYPRSGLGFKYGVKLRNTTGIIDCDYRDEIRVSLSSDERVVIPKGKAYMQGIIQPIFTLDNEIEPTEERKGGLGSTDKDSCVDGGV